MSACNQKSNAVKGRSAHIIPHATEYSHNTLLQSSRETHSLAKATTSNVRASYNTDRSGINTQMPNPTDIERTEPKHTASPLTKNFIHQESEPKFLGNPLWTQALHPLKLRI